MLILGETGTGKELLARAVHDISRRRERPLVKVNCAALAENLIENELFGHERGAFTGAAARKTGRFELADGGTLFLDEVGELPLDLQAKMLRVLQEGEFERLGGTETLRVDVRVIAATNRDLQRDVGEGRFRQDLFYRLNVFPIRSLPLRERREDIPLLVRHFVGKFSGETGRQVDSVPSEVMERLVAYDWPGNVRELENVVERALIVSPRPQAAAGRLVRTRQAGAATRRRNPRSARRERTLDRGGGGDPGGERARPHSRGAGADRLAHPRRPAGPRKGSTSSRRPSSPGMKKLDIARRAPRPTE